MGHVAVIVALVGQREAEGGAGQRAVAKPSLADRQNNQKDGCGGEDGGQPGTEPDGSNGQTWRVGCCARIRHSENSECQNSTAAEKRQRPPGKQTKKRFAARRPRPGAAKFGVRPAEASPKHTLLVRQVPIRPQGEPVGPFRSPRRG